LELEPESSTGAEATFCSQRDGSGGGHLTPEPLHLNFIINWEEVESDKGAEHAFNENGIAVEGYQKPSIKGEVLSDLHHDVIVKE
jgi:hypothetical protein